MIPFDSIPGEKPRKNFSVKNKELLSAQSVKNELNNNDKIETKKPPIRNIFKRSNKSNSKKIISNNVDSFDGIMNENVDLVPDKSVEHNNSQRMLSFKQNYHLEDNNNQHSINDLENIQFDKILYLNDIRNRALQDIIKLAHEYQIEDTNRMLKHDIITSILKKGAEQGEGLYCEGVLEINGKDNFGFLRYADINYETSSCDIFISQQQIRKYGLRKGDQVSCYARSPRKNDKYFSMLKFELINGLKLEDIKNKINFENLTPLHPTDKWNFGNASNTSARCIDLICPIGKGQRALIVAPPKVGKTYLMQNIAHAITDNNPEAKLFVLLIDERPEEVTDMSRTVKGEVVSSTFDQPASRHVALAEIVVEKAKRAVECGEDVVILLDSITRLARAYNSTLPSSGKILTGGVDSNALQRPKRFFGAARNIEHGGSLTIIATALVDTGSKMDEVIFEEFKGTGNSEIILDRKIADKRIYPALDIVRSGTRKEEEMINSDMMQKRLFLRRMLMQKDNSSLTNAPNIEGLDFLIKQVGKSKNNDLFFEMMNSNR